MKRFKKNIVILLALLAALLLSACGGKSGETNTADTNNTPQSTQSGDNGSAAPVSVAAKGKASVTVYKVGSDKLAFLVTGDCCEGVAPRGEYEDGSDTLWLAVGDDWETQASLYTFYGHIGYRKGEEWVDYSSEYRTGIIAAKNLYFVEIDNPGLCAEVPFDGDYQLRCMPNGGENNENMTVASGKAADIVKTVSEEEFAAIRTGVYMQVEPQSKAQADWAGRYLTDQWSDTQGYLEVEVSELGMLHFHVITGDMEKDFFGEEHDYDKASYDYGDYVSAQVDISAQSESTSFHLSQESDGRTTISFNHSDYNSSKHINADFARIDALWRQAPEDYEDIDRYGQISAVEPGDAQYFSPATDDYCIRYQNRYSYTANGTEYPCTYQELFAFDENGFVVDRKLKCVFASEDAASAVLRQLTSDGMTGYAASGKALYYAFEITPGYSYYDNKLSEANYHNWYVGCHYAYDRYETDSEYFSYTYLSKPITEQEFSATVEDMLFWQSIPSGEHYCIDAQSASLRTYVEDAGVGVSVYDDYNGMASDSGMQRFHGRSGESITYNNTWDSATDSYRWQVIVKEYVFTETEAEVTEYRYNVENPVGSGVTLDNYKSKTADQTLTHRFDLTRVKN